MAQERGVRAVEDVLEHIRPQYWDEKVFKLNPTEAPFMRFLTKLRKKSVTDSYFNWFEDDLLAEWDEVTNNAGTGATLTVANTDYFSPGDVVKIPSTGEIVLVTAVTGDGAGDLTVTRGQGTTVATAIDGSGTAVPILNLGNASEEFSGRPEILSKKKVRVYNYAEIVKTSFGVSGTLDKTKLRTGNELDYQRGKKGIEHTRKLEKKFLFGERGSNTAGSKERRYTGGVINFIDTNGQNEVVATLTAFTETVWNAWLKDLFLEGSDEKVVFASSTIVDKLNSFPSGKLQTAIGIKIYGVNVMKFTSPHGTVMLVNHKKVLKEAYAGTAIGIDMDKVMYRFLEGRDTALYKNVQDNDVDGEIDMFLTECGLQIANPEAHGYLTITDITS